MRFRRQESAGYMTNRAARLFARAIDERLGALGLSSGHMPVLLTLADGSERSQKDLAAAAAVEQPTMAATLARMQRDGLVTRRRDPDDGRASLFALTAQIRARVGQVIAAAIEVNDRALAPLSADERRLYMDMLARIVAALDGEAEGESR